MTEQQKHYIKSHRLWLKGTHLTIQEYELSIQQNKAMISHLRRQIDLDELRVENDVKYLDQAVFDFNNYCKESGIDPDVVILEA